MAVADLRLSADARQKLGRQGIADLSRELHAIDCQVCGVPLGTQTPGVSITDLGRMAQARLHHMDCAKPSWRAIDSFVSTPRDGEHLSYHTFVMLPPLPVLDNAELTPLILLNPGLETAFLYPHNKKWRVDTLRKYRTSFGMERCSPGSSLPQIKGATLTSYRSNADKPLAFNLQVGTPNGWLMSVPRPIASLITRDGGAVLLLTATEDPLALSRTSGGFTMAGVADLLRPATCIIGWVPYSPGSTPPRHRDDYTVTWQK